VPGFLDGLLCLHLSEQNFAAEEDVVVPERPSLEVVLVADDGADLLPDFILRLPVQTVISSGIFNVNFVQIDHTYQPIYRRCSSTRAVLQM